MVTTVAFSPQAPLFFLVTWSATQKRAAVIMWGTSIGGRGVRYLPPGRERPALIIMVVVNQQLSIETSQRKQLTSIATLFIRICREA